MKVRAKKYLGQHFLRDEALAHQIVQALDTEPLEHVLEIGPGMGVLTQHLLQAPNFKAYEVDPASVAYLTQQYPAHATRFLLQDFLELTDFQARTGIIGNLPYNVSSPIFFKVWENHDDILQVVGMVQLEVAERIVAAHGNKTYGILSVLLQAYYHIDWVVRVPPEVFDPPPKVHSAVLKLQRNNRKGLPVSDAFFKRLVKVAFGQRRKTLRNALKPTGWSLSQVNQINLNLRAEQLSVADFIVLAQELAHGNPDQL